MITKLPKLNTPLLSNILKMLGGNGSSQFFNLLTSTILFKFASSEDVSKIFVLLGVFHIVNHFTDFGINTSFLKLYGKYKRDEKVKESGLIENYLQTKSMIVTVILIFGLMAGYLCSVLGISLSYSLNDLFILLIIIAFEQMNATQLNILRSDENFNLIAINSFVGAFLKLIFVSICVYFKFTDILLLAFFSQSFTSFIFGLIHVRRSFTFNFKGSLSFIGSIFHSTKWIYISLLCSAAISQIDVFMVKYYLSNDAVAQLVSGQKYASIIPFVSMTLSTVLLPHVLNKSDKEVKSFIKNYFKLVPFFLVMIPIFIGGAYPVFKFFLSGVYENAFTVYSIYIFAYVMGMFATSLSTVLYHSDNEKIIALMTLSQVIINLISNYFFILWLGPSGAALTTAILKFSSLVIICYFVWRKFYVEKAHA